jgi:cytochrome oxidase Cu insertion factor (SCO1/SenC/PrrC family)
MTNDMPELPSPRPAVTRRIPIAIAAVVVGALIGFAGVYGIGGLRRNATGDAACRGAVDLARKIAPLARGEVAALTMATAPLRLPDLAFEDADGKPRKLSDWRGRTVLVNLWATWCVPCRKEMPALEGLQTRLGGGRHQHRHPRPPETEELPERRPSDPARLFQRRKSQGFSGS